MKTNEINIRDPFVLLQGDTYYLYGTRGPTCWGPATGFDVYTGTDLENWEGPVPCFENDGTFWADRNYWAPEVHPRQGAFFIIQCRRRLWFIREANAFAASLATVLL